MVQVSLAFNLYGHYLLTALDQVRFRNLSRRRNVPDSQTFVPNPTKEVEFTQPKTFSHEDGNGLTARS